VSSLFARIHFFEGTFALSSVFNPLNPSVTPPFGRDGTSFDPLTSISNPTGCFATTLGA
jgi:hypothetical protein